jgi:tRNA threonylcarbamoyladenosine biosynthesis protein TsaB
MRLLALDTATECCSAAVLIDNQLITREEELVRGHAERILPLIDELLAQAGLALSRLDAIAFGRGPGSFTGVRLAASITQGLAFGAGLAVVPVSDLLAVAQRVFSEEPASERVLVCNDARMREVYWAGFERGTQGLATAASPERVGKPDTLALPAAWGGAGSTKLSVVGAGRGLREYPSIVRQLGLMRAHADWLPRSREIAILAAGAVGKGELQGPEAAIPVYLRDEVAQIPPKTPA